MALLLKHRQKRKNSIQVRFAECMKQILLFLMMGTVLGIGFYMQANIRFEKSNERILKNGEFFTKLAETQENMYKSLFLISEVDRTCLDELESYIIQFKEDTISTIYQRDTEDLFRLFAQYKQNAQELERSLKSGDGYTQAHRFYKEMTVLFDAINQYQDPVQGQIILYEKHVVEEQKRSISLYTTVFVICFVLILLSSVYEIKALQRQLVQPIQILSDSISKVNLQNPLPSAVQENRELYHDEISEALQAYNVMLNRIQRQNLEHEEYIAAKLQLQQQMYLNLQHQINPHFLFNTLNMIAQTAYLEGNERTVDLIEITAKLLRYSLDCSDREVTLNRELEALEQYVSIQENRFGDRITFVFDLDDSLGHLKLPSLVLQPLVENAISHGVGAYESGGEIYIQTRLDKERNQVRVSVIDNGIGMTPDQKKAVEERMKRRKTETQSIGLSNVYFRLKLFFQEQADVEILSVPYERTEIALLLPFKEG